MSMFSLKKLALVAFVGAGMTLSGCLTNDKEEEKPPIDTNDTHTALPTEKTISVGAQGATAGSSVDLDAGTVLQSGAANAALETVDLVFMYYGSAFHIDNTTSAKAAGVANTINLTDSWTAAKLNTNQFVKVTAKPADQEAAYAAFLASSSKLSSSTVASGDMFIVETSENEFVMLTVSAMTGTDKTGGADFKISITTF